MLAIKVTTRNGLCLEDYGAQIVYPFAVGEKEHCFEEIKKDILFNAKCEKDSGSRLFFINGRDFNDEDNAFNKDELEKYIDEDIARGCTWICIKLQADDVYNSIYEITYQMFEESEDKA